MNCDLNVYSHIPYKPLQHCDYKGEKYHFYARIKVPIVYISYMNYFKLYHALLDLK
jgi:hypothetical protein